MKKFLKAASVAVAVLLGGVAHAGFVNIGGLNVPQGAHFEVTSIYENIVVAVGQELKGYGEVSQINGQNISDLCAGCELTYRFSGYTVTSITASAVTFTGGLVEMYLGFGLNNDFNPFASANSAADLAAATNGTLFLTLAGHDIDAAGNTFAGSGNNIGTVNAAGNGAGLLDVVRGVGLGIAQGNFDTNSIAALFGDPFADVQLGSSFSNVFLPHPLECAGPLALSGQACLAGSNDIRGLVIPEPSSLALFGVALLGLAASARRRRG